MCTRGVSVHVFCPGLAAYMYSTKCIQIVCACILYRAGCLPVQHKVYTRGLYMYFVQGWLLTCTALNVYKKCEVCPGLAAYLFSTKCIQEVCILSGAGCLPVQH